MWLPFFFAPPQSPGPRVWPRWAWHYSWSPEARGAMVPWVGAEKLQISGQLTQLTIQNADLFHDLTMKKPWRTWDLSTKKGWETTNQRGWDRGDVTETTESFCQPWGLGGIKHQQKWWFSTATMGISPTNNWKLSSNHGDFTMTILSSKCWSSNRISYHPIIQHWDFTNK